jgi:hypothetical protein
MKAAEHVDIPGPVAEDKDFAREMREQRILPALARGRGVCLDFTGVATTTQSFVHACLSEAVRTHGEEVLEQFEFRGCKEDVRQLIETVVEYSLRARTLTHTGLSGRLRRADVPQADSLARVRDVMAALAAGGATPEDIVAATGFSLRHVHYRLHAARVLGLVTMGRNIASLTDRGRDAVRAPRDSAKERATWEQAIRESATLKSVAPNLLAKRAPTARELARRLEQKTGLSPATALRRAKALLRWRRAILDPQASLFAGP